MTDAQTLWSSVVANYPEPGLIDLTNIRDAAGSAIVTSVGESAAQETIDLWPAWAEVDFDVDNATHVAVARRGVIAVLWRRGAASSTIEKEEWDAVFGDSGMISRVRRTGARAHEAPVTDGPQTNSSGTEVYGWSNDKSMPPGFMPRRRGVR